MKVLQKYVACILAYDVWSILIIIISFRLRGKMEPTSLSGFGGCSFELEICYLPDLNPPQIDKTPTKSILKNSALKYNTPVQYKKTHHDKNSCTAKVGIRRKRLKGNSWCYKKVCEEVLALTSSNLKQPIESSV